MMMNRHLNGVGQLGKLLRWSVLLLLAFAHPAWSAISLVGSTSVARSGTSGSLVLAYPAGLAADDVLIAQIAVRGNVTIPTVPAGWTLINRTNNGSALTQAVYWKRAGASNPANETWIFSPSDRAAGTMSAYRDVDPIVPVNVFSAQTNGGSANVAASSITPGVAGTQLVGLYALADGNASFSPPAGMAERQDVNTKGGKNGITVELADEAYAGTAATGVRTALASDSADGIGHLIALQPSTLASYRMDESTWAGAGGEVVDSSGRGHHATAVNGTAIGGTAPAISGNPGTCGYGMFDGSNDYVAVPASFPNLTTDFTITAWIRTTNNAKGGQRIFIDDQSNAGGYGLSLGDGGTGRLRFYTRAVAPIILDTNNVIQNNTWYFVAAVANIVAKTKSIYVYNQAGTLLAFVTQTYAGTWGTDNGAASIGGENNASAESSSSFKFSGNLDEVSVFSGALNAAKLQRRDEPDAAVQRNATGCAQRLQCVRNRHGRRQRDRRDPDQDCGQRLRPRSRRPQDQRDGGRNRLCRRCEAGTRRCVGGRQLRRACPDPQPGDAYLRGRRPGAQDADRHQRTQCLAQCADPHDVSGDGRADDHRLFDRQLRHPAGELRWRGGERCRQRYRGYRPHALLTPRRAAATCTRLAGRFALRRRHTTQPAPPPRITPARPRPA